ncbi:hypothetical protein [Kribbella endophytica]
MKVELLQVEPSGHVRFTCEIGTAIGRWMGPNAATAGQFHVEFEIPEDVTDWVPASPGPAALAEVPGEGHAALITAEVLGLTKGDDAVVELRLGSDVLLIEVPHRRSELSVEDLISFRVPEIQLYPYEL